jgi:branched-chain amino acid aminotransferase
MLDPRVKSLNYLNNVLAKLEAQRHGSDEALVLNAHGTIAEASAANVFARIDGVVATPTLGDGALGGITRRRILNFLREANLPVEERSLTRFDLLSADEVFLSGTGAGIVPVAVLDGERLGDRRETSTALTGMTLDYARRHGFPVPGLVDASLETAKDQHATMPQPEAH